MAVSRTTRGGTGLFRSEFIYLYRIISNRGGAVRIYKQAAETMAGKRVINCTPRYQVDNSAIISRWKEQNPALAAVRSQPHLPGRVRFTQPCAVPRKRIWKNGYYKINDHKCRRGSPDQSDCGGSVSPLSKVLSTETMAGIMIETPAAAIIKSELAKEVGFLQYRNERP